MKPDGRVVDNGKKGHSDLFVSTRIKVGGLVIAAIVAAIGLLNFLGFSPSEVRADEARLTRVESATKENSAGIERMEKQLERMDKKFTEWNRSIGGKLDRLLEREDD